MFRKPIVVTCLVTACLLIFHLLSSAGILPWLTAIIFLLSPILVAWLAYTILKHGKYDGPELGEGQEWGYQDRDKSSLGTF